MIAWRGLKAAALQQQHIPAATHPLHSACSTGQPGRVTGAALGAQRRALRLGEGPQLSANAAATSFYKLGLSPFFSFFLFEEKAIKMTL